MPGITTPINASKVETVPICYTKCDQAFKISQVIWTELAKFDYFSNFVTYNFLLQYGMATQFSEIVHNLTGFPTQPKYYISVLRYVCRITWYKLF